MTEEDFQSAEEFCSMLDGIDQLRVAAKSLKAGGWLLASEQTSRLATKLAEAAALEEATLWKRGCAAALHRQGLSFRSAFETIGRSADVARCRDAAIAYLTETRGMSQRKISSITDFPLKSVRWSLERRRTARAA